MLKFGNKEFRNLQEQVLKNMQDINSMKEGTAVLDEFGIKVIGEVDSLADLPTVAEYKEAHEDWAYGDAYAVGTEAPYTLYILTRENETTTEDHWFDIGEFPAPGPQGEAGPEGPIGPQGQTGNPGTDGASAGFGTITATAQTLVPGSSATATVVASGPDTAKSFAFTFGIPRGQKGEPGGVTDVEVNDDTVVVDGVAKIDLDQYAIAFLDRNQTFNGNNTFNGNATFTNGIRAAVIKPLTDSAALTIGLSASGVISRGSIKPYSSNTFSLGLADKKWHTLFLSNGLKDGNSNYALTLPNSTSWTANKTIATTDDIPDAVSGTNDGTNWTSLTIGSATYGIGGGSAPSNMVTTDTAQTISGAKTFGSNILPSTDGTLDLGSYSNKWQYLYLGGGVVWGSSYITEQNNNIVINPAGTSVVAKMDNQKDLGAISKRWSDLYLAGSLKDGTNSISVANIANKNNFITLTQAQYDALSTKDPNTLYFIEEE